MANGLAHNESVAMIANSFIYVVREPLVFSQIARNCNCANFFSIFRKGAFTPNFSHLVPSLIFLCYCIYCRQNTSAVVECALTCMQQECIVLRLVLAVQSWTVRWQKF